MELLARFRPDLAATVDPPLEGRAPLLSIDRARRTFGYDADPPPRTVAVTMRSTAGVAPLNQRCRRRSGHGTM